MDSPKYVTEADKILERAGKKFFLKSTAVIFIIAATIVGPILYIVYHDKISDWLEEKFPPPKQWW